MRLVYSVRSADELIYADELGEETIVTYSREPPPGWDGHLGRIDAALIEASAAGARLAFVCGSTGFVEAASDLLLDAGMPAEAIRTERFGPTS